jgi:hypothetical protein
MDSSSEDSSEDDESEDENPEEPPEDNGAEDEDLDGMVREGKGARDGRSRNGSSQQRNNNSDIEGNVARDDDTIGTSSMPLTGEHKNALSTSHISLPGDIGKAGSVNPVPLKGLSPSSLPPKSEKDVKMNRMSSQKDLPLGMHKSPPKRLRKGCNTRAGNDGQAPHAHACKRRKSTNVSEPQKNRKSNCQERSIAVAWMKAHAHEGWNESERARAYESNFGIKRTTTTLKHWMDDPKNSQESRIVELKIPSPRLREILSNDDS